MHSYLPLVIVLFTVHCRTTGLSAGVSVLHNASAGLEPVHEGQSALATVRQPPPLQELSYLWVCINHKGELRGAIWRGVCCGRVEGITVRFLNSHTLFNASPNL